MKSANLGHIGSFYGIFSTLRTCLVNKLQIFALLKTLFNLGCQTDGQGEPVEGGKGGVCQHSQGGFCLLHV